MHKIHHHYKQPLTDTNYGNIFSIWDRLFSTHTNVADQKSIIYGVDTYMNKENKIFKSLLLIPFKRNLNKD